MLGGRGIPASFDMPGYAQAMMGVNPMKGMQLMQSLQKELLVDKINPEKFTPASLAKFAQTRNFGDLVPRDKLEFVEGVGVNPYDPANANRAIPNPNKPFAMDASGNIVPNRAYQDYEIRKASAGAARTNVNVDAGPKRSGATSARTPRMWFSRSVRVRKRRHPRCKASGNRSAERTRRVSW